MVKSLGLLYCLIGTLCLGLSMIYFVLCIKDIFFDLHPSYLPIFLLYFVLAGINFWFTFALSEE
uniref:Transmembrane protein n=1 Tax=viral metagenome TaxID=1070528 RepID=A0A6H1ZMG8_9ZZZZ